MTYFHRELSTNMCIFIIFVKVIILNLERYGDNVFIFIKHNKNIVVNLIQVMYFQENNTVPKCIW